MPDIFKIEGQLPNLRLTVQEELITR